MTTYCDYCNTHPEDSFNHSYHATQYGFTLIDDNFDLPQYGSFKGWLEAHHPLSKDEWTKIFKKQ